MHTYDVLVLTETWLHADIFNSEFIDSRYYVYRSDRNRAATGRRDGGGVLIAVLRSLPAAPCAPPPRSPTLPSPIPPLVDSMLVELSLGNFKYVIGAVYIPPNLSTETYCAYFEYMQHLLLQLDYDEFCLLGDFNLPKLDWYKRGNSMELSSLNDLCGPHNYLSNFISVFNCSQINTFKNNQNRLLDLCLTNIVGCESKSAPITLVPPDEHHPPFYIMMPNPCGDRYLPYKSQIRFCFREADYTIINNCLLEFDWDNLFLNKSSETCLSILYESIYDVIRKNIPTKYVSQSSYPVWFNSALIHIFKNKDTAWIKWKKYRNKSDYELFSMYRKRFKKESQLCYNKYIHSVEESIKSNINYFWTYIKHRKNKSCIPSNVTYLNQLAKTPVDTCNLFSNFFQSVFQPTDVGDSFGIEHMTDLNINTEINLNVCEITLSTDIVLKGLKALDPSKGAGIDNVPPVFLKYAAESLMKPLHYLFNNFLKEGYFPDLWKSARITPVHKDGSRKEVTNYRPISILSALSKLFEKLVHDAIYPLIHNNIIPQQHGFVKKRSTVTNLFIYMTDLFKNLDVNDQTDSVYTDFRKAFDRVDHKILLEKLAYNGIRGNLWRWFKSYITNRTQKVMINGYESNTIPITSGVPQGSILGPLLFVIFINDIGKCFKFCDYLLYADDLKIYHVIKDSSDHHKFQEDLHQFDEYCRINKLKLSVDKCKTITFTKKKHPRKHTYILGGTTLESVHTIKDLGITLDSKLTLDKHVNNICNKAYAMYGFVIRSSNEFKRSSTYIHLYKSLIRSQLEYATVVWSPFYQKYISDVEKVQKKILKCVQFKCYRSRMSYAQLLDRHNLLDLKSRRLQLQATLLYDVCHYIYDCASIVNNIAYHVPVRSYTRACRSSKLFHTTRCRTNTGKRSPLYRMADTYNRYFSNIDIFALTPGAYRKAVIDEIKLLDLHNDP